MVAARMITRMRCLRATATMACMRGRVRLEAASVAGGGAVDEKRAARDNGLTDAETLAHFDEAVGRGADLDRAGDDGFLVGPRDPDAGLSALVDHRLLRHRGHQATLA